MDSHAGALYIKRAGKYLAYPHTGADVQQMEQTIKGLDRRTREYQEIVAEKNLSIFRLEELVAFLKDNQLTLQKKVEELDGRLADDKYDAYERDMRQSDHT